MNVAILKLALSLRRTMRRYRNLPPSSFTLMPAVTVRFSPSPLLSGRAPLLVPRTTPLLSKAAVCLAMANPSTALIAVPTNTRIVQATVLRAKAIPPMSKISSTILRAPIRPLARGLLVQEIPPLRCHPCPPLPFAAVVHRAPVPDAWNIMVQMSTPLPLARIRTAALLVSSATSTLSPPWRQAVAG